MEAIFVGGGGGGGGWGVLKQNCPLSGGMDVLWNYCWFSVSRHSK